MNRQKLLQDIVATWRTHNPGGVASVAYPHAGKWTSHVQDIYLSIHHHAGVHNAYPHIHIFNERRDKSYDYLFTVSCAEHVHHIRETIDFTKYTPLNYCTYFTQMLTRYCGASLNADSAPASAGPASASAVKLFTPRSVPPRRQPPSQGGRHRTFKNTQRRRGRCNNRRRTTSIIIK